MWPFYTKNYYDIIKSFKWDIHEDQRTDKKRGKYKKAVIATNPYISLQYQIENLKNLIIFKPERRNDIIMLSTQVIIPVYSELFSVNQELINEMKKSINLYKQQRKINKLKKSMPLYSGESANKFFDLLNRGQDDLYFNSDDIPFTRISLISNYSLTHKEKLLMLLRECFPKDEATWTVTFESMLRYPFLLWFIAYRGEEIVGVLSIRQTDGRCFLENLCTGSEYHRQGIAGYLISWTLYMMCGPLEGVKVTLGVDTVNLTEAKATALVKMYQNIGFVVDQPTQNSFNRKGIIEMNFLCGNFQPLMENRILIELDKMENTIKNRVQELVIKNYPESDFLRYIKIPENRTRVALSLLRMKQSDKEFSKKELEQRFRAGNPCPFFEIGIDELNKLGDLAQRTYIPLEQLVYCFEKAGRDLGTPINEVIKQVFVNNELKIQKPRDTGLVFLFHNDKQIAELEIKQLNKILIFIIHYKPESSESVKPPPPPSRRPSTMKEHEKVYVNNGLKIKTSRNSGLFLLCHNDKQIAELEIKHLNKTLNFIIRYKPKTRSEGDVIVEHIDKSGDRSLSPEVIRDEIGVIYEKQLEEAENREEYIRDVTFTARAFSFHFDGLINGLIRDRPIFNKLVKYYSNGDYWGKLSECSYPTFREVCESLSYPLETVSDVESAESPDEFEENLDEHFSSFITNVFVILQKLYTNLFRYSISLDYDIVVYRGIYIDPEESFIFTNTLTGFTSTSYGIENAIQIMMTDYDDNTTRVVDYMLILKIIIPAGTKFFTTNLCTVQIEDEIILVDEGKIDNVEESSFTFNCKTMWETANPKGGTPWKPCLDIDGQEIPSDKSITVRTISGSFQATRKVPEPDFKAKRSEAFGQMAVGKWIKDLGF